MEMRLKDRIFDDLKQAMKEGKKDELRVLRALKAAILEKAISERKDGEAELTDDQVTEVLMKAAQQRKEAIGQLEEGGRQDLADKEKLELGLIDTCLSDMMSAAEIIRSARQTIRDTGASSMVDMGKVMGAMMARLKGQADGALISKVVKDELS